MIMVKNNNESLFLSAYMHSRLFIHIPLRNSMIACKNVSVICCANILDFHFWAEIPIVWGCWFCPRRFTWTHKFYKQFVSECNITYLEDVPKLVWTFLCIQLSIFSNKPWFFANFLHERVLTKGHECLTSIHFVMKKPRLWNKPIKFISWF